MAIPAMPRRAPSWISTPLRVGPTVGANRRGKNTPDVLIGELKVGPLLRVDTRRKSRLRKRDGTRETRGFTQVRPLDEVKTYFMSFLFYMRDLDYKGDVCRRCLEN